MKRLISCWVLLLFILSSLGAAAVEGKVEGKTNDEDPVPAPELFLGGYLGFGLAAMLGNGNEFFRDLGGIWPTEMEDRTMRFTGGGGVYLSYDIAALWAVDVGVGLTSNGFRYKGTGDDGEYRALLKVLYMDFPFMAKLKVENFHISAGLVLSVALSGVGTIREGSSKIVERWNDRDWRPWNRVNIGPRIGAGYAIPVGPVVVIPGVTWSMHLVDELNDKEIDALYNDDRSLRFRAMTLIFQGAVEWGFY